MFRCQMKGEQRFVIHERSKRDKGLHRCRRMEKNVHGLCNSNTIDALDETKHSKGRATTANLPVISSLDTKESDVQPYLSIR